MKHKEKYAFLVNEHRGEWLKTRKEVFDELSSKQSMFCCCGRLATGLHEDHCSKFRHKVDAETIKRLKHLIPKQ